MKIAIGSDHGGVELKAALLKSISNDVVFFDKGPADKSSCDYPD